MSGISDDLRPVDQFRQDMSRSRQAIAQRLAVEPLAHSADGHAVIFQAPLTTPLPTGSYVRLRTISGADYLGQILGREVAEREGPEITLEGDAGLGVDAGGQRVASTAYRIRLKRVEGHGVLLGRLNAEDVPPTTPADLFEDAEITLAEEHELERYMLARTAQGTRLDIGTVRAGGGTVRAALRADGFDRHTFLCGQSGSGKTYALGVILERLLLETSLRLVIIDPNSDFVKLHATRSFEEAARGFGPDHTRDGHAALSDRYRAATERVRVLRPVPRGQTAPNALRARFSDLAPMVQATVLQIDPLQDPEEYNALTSVISRMGRTTYSLAELQATAASDLSHGGRSLALRIANLGVAEWDIWAEHDEPSIADPDSPFHDSRAVVLDVGGFDRAEEKSLVATGVFGAFWRQREQRQPVLIVIDEAHNVCAQEPADRLQAVATERAIRIAGEGRKFGLYLLLATQRPQKLHANVVSQCDNLVLMRMNSASDLAQLAASFSFVPSSMLNESTAFRQGESLIAGKIVPSPIIARFGGRVSQEGGSDIPTTWATR